MLTPVKLVIDYHPPQSPNMVQKKVFFFLLFISPLHYVRRVLSTPFYCHIRKNKVKKGYFSPFLGLSAIRHAHREQKNTTAFFSALLALRNCRYLLTREEIWTREIGFCYYLALYCLLLQMAVPPCEWPFHANYLYANDFGFVIYVPPPSPFHPLIPFRLLWRDIVVMKPCLIMDDRCSDNPFWFIMECLLTRPLRLWKVSRFDVTVSTVALCWMINQRGSRWLQIKSV